MPLTLNIRLLSTEPSIINIPSKDTAAQLDLPSQCSDEILNASNTVPSGIASQDLAIEGLTTFLREIPLEPCQYRHQKLWKQCH